MKDEPSHSWCQPLWQVYLPEDSLQIPVPSFDPGSGLSFCGLRGDTAGATRRPRRRGRERRARCPGLSPTRLVPSTRTRVDRTQASGQPPLALLLASLFPKTGGKHWSRLHKNPFFIILSGVCFLCWAPATFKERTWVKTTVTTGALVEEGAWGSWPGP